MFACLILNLNWGFWLVVVLLMCINVPVQSDQLLSEHYLTLTVSGSRIVNTLIIVNLFKSVLLLIPVLSFLKSKSFSDVLHHRGFEHVTLAESQSRDDGALPLWGVLDEVVNIGASSMAIFLMDYSCRGEAAEGYSCQEFCSWAKTRVVSSDELSSMYGATGTAKFLEFLPHVRW